MCITCGKFNYQIRQTNNSKPFRIDRVYERHRGTYPARLYNVIKADVLIIMPESWFLCPCKKCEIV